MSEQSERERLVIDLLRQLWLGLSSYRLFPGQLDRAGFRTTAERISVAAERVLRGGELTVEIHGSSFVLGESHLPSDGVIDRLAMACFERRLERLGVRAVPDHATLDAMFRVLATPVDELDEAGGAEEMFTGAGVDAISLGRVGPAPVTGADHVPAAQGREQEPIDSDGAPTAYRLEALLEDLSGASVDQAETLLERFRALAASRVPDLEADVDLHRRIHGAIEQLPIEIRRTLVGMLVDRMTDDPLAEGLLGAMSGAELARALVDLGRAGDRDPVELARQLASAGRPADVIDLAAALAAGHEEAGTILAGLERIGIEAVEVAERGSDESLSDVMARYLVATEEEDRRSLRVLFPDDDEHVRSVAMADLGDYLLLDDDPIRLGDVLDLWVGEVRTALRSRDRRRVERLLEVVGPAEQGDREAHRAGLIEGSRRRVFDAGLVADLVTAETEQEGSPVPDMLRVFGDLAVEALLDALAAEQDRGRRALLIGMLRRVAEGHHGPVVTRIGDERWYVVRNAVSILRSVGGAEVLTLLAEAARHPAAAVRREATLGLAAAGGLEAIPHLKVLASDPDPQIRSLAVDALGALAGQPAAAALTDVARAGIALDTRRSAIELLAHHSAPEASELLGGLASRRTRPRLPRALRRHARSLARGLESGR